MVQVSSQQSVQSDDLLTRLDQQIAEHFPVHPFVTGITRDNFRGLISQYVAMSVAFPYIQAGAIHAFYRHSLQRRATPDDCARVAAAVAAFLVWDEFGGHELVTSRGPAGLEALIQVDHNFHSALLIGDVRRLVGQDFTDSGPDAHTAVYLDRLLAGLSEPEGAMNIAHMLAFERHALAMITGLLGAIQYLFGPLELAQLRYFAAHVGSSTTGEVIHQAMTGAMVRQIVAAVEEAQFIERCLAAYALSVDWCTGLLSASAPPLHAGAV